MVIVTEALRAFLKSKGKIQDGADEAAVKNATMGMILAKEATVEQVNELCKPAMSQAEQLGDIVAKSVAASLAAAGIVTGQNRDLDTAFDKLTKSQLPSGISNGEESPTDLLVKAINSGSMSGNGGNDEGRIRVKSFGERFDGSTKSLCYPMKMRNGDPHAYAGQQAEYMGKKLDYCSDRGKAVGAAWFKFQIAANTEVKSMIPACLRMTETDKKLVEFALNECEFSGHIHDTEADENSGRMISVVGRKLFKHEIKSLIDDGTSGGIEIAPIEFDNALVTIPVLYGELFPHVNVVPVTRGRRMKGGAISNPTFANVVEGTAITPYDTTSFVSAFDTNIFVAAGSMEIGMDFEDDSPTNVGQIIIQKYGEKALEWLDRVVAVGNGTSEPQGVVNASGIVTVNSDNGSGGPPTVSDYEGLMFGVAKQYRTTKGAKNVYIANETSYRRARGIAVGPSDERRVFGMTHGDYMLIDQPYKINASVPNNQIAYANLGYYRMYRRLGMNVRVENAGNYLASRNIRLIVVRMRYGGKMELGGAASLINDAQS